MIINFKFTSIAVILISLFTPLISNAQKSEVKSSSCKSFFESKEAKKLVSQLGQLKTINDVWPDYRPESLTTLLTQSSPNHLSCAIVIQKGKVTHRLSFEGQLEFENGLFFMFAGVPIAGKIPLDVIKFFEKEKITSAAFYNLIPFPETADLPDYAQYMLGKDDFHLNVITHEGFHLNSIIAVALGNLKIPWPKWDVQPERKIGSLCYVGEEWKNEQSAINAAYKLLYLQNNSKMALSAAQDFIRWREARYKALKDVRVPSKASKEGVSCEQAEAMLELEEGGADFVGTASSLDLGITSAYQVSEHLLVYHDWYYRSGLAQLLFIRKMSRSESLQSIRRLSSANSWQQGIYWEFKNFVKKKSELL